jgi:transcription elongation factor GreA
MAPSAPYAPDPVRGFTWSCVTPSMWLGLIDHKKRLTAAIGDPGAAVFVRVGSCCGRRPDRSMAPAYVGKWLGASVGFGQKADLDLREPFRRPARGDLEQTRMSNDRIPMSKEGYEKKKAQLDNMKNEEMPRIAEQIALARGFGDLSENAEFDAAVEAQGMLQARINDLQNMLGQAYIVEKSNVPSDRVVYGSKVRVVDLSINEEEDFILVGPGEEDYDQNKILLTSPIGQGLVGKKVGEQVEVQIPRGVLKLKIVEIGVS